MKTPEGKRGSSISEIQVFANKVAAEEKSQLTIRVNGDVLPGVNSSVTDYYIDVIGLIHKWKRQPSRSCNGCYVHAGANPCHP